MRKLIGLAIVFLTLQSCENHCIENHFAIVNNSGKDVEISSYKININSGEATFSKKFTISNNSKYEKTLRDCTGQVGKFNFQTFVGGDSISIDYGDRVQGYYFFLYNVRSPYYLTLQNKSYDFIYTLTPEDYANATPKP